MKKIILLATLCMPLLFGNCAKKIVDTTVSIYGTVVDAETQSPLDGVQVRLSPGTHEKHTGDDGYFEFVNLEHKQYSLQAHKVGYKTNYRMVYYNAGEKIELIIPLEKNKIQ